MAMKAIQRVEVANLTEYLPGTSGEDRANRFSSWWNVEVNDYVYPADSKVSTDFEMLIVTVSTTRAATIEAEIYPLQMQVSKRNDDLKELGDALAELSKCQAALGSDAKGSDDTRGKNVEIHDTTVATVGKWFGNNYFFTENGVTYITKANCEELIQLIKTQVDKLNNDSQSDLTRLQGLVDKRDEAYSTASSQMQGVSDTRGNLLKNLV